MDTRITGYQLDAELHHGHSSLVYRGTRLRDDRPVVVKVLKNEFPTPRETARYEREFRIASPLRLALAVRVLELTQQDHRSVLVYEDDGCVSLHRLFGGRRPDTEEFLRVAIAAAQALAQVHSSKLIHCDVSLANLLINPKSGQVKLTDFELARVQDDDVDDATRAMGTLKCMAPEQSGRAKLRADLRADLYSLGASLFELACARPVFVGLDDASLLHAHFALAPESVCESNPDFPPVLDAIVQKLLAKSPSDRYQSAQGLLSDLQRVQHQLLRDEPLHALVLGRADQTLGLRNMEHLVGSEQLLAQLQAARDEAFQREGPVWVRLRGAAGSGKSAVVARFAQSLRDGCVILSGRGDVLAQSGPYAALIAAFDCLLRQWLSCSEQDLASLREDLHDAMGVNLAVLQPMMPRLSQIVGSLPAPQPLGADAEQARFVLALRNFLKLAVSRQRPLIFFIDDLQWVDSASLLLIERFLQNDHSPCLVLTAERDEDPPAALAGMLERLQASSITASVRVLQPLTRGQLGELLDHSVGEMEGGVGTRAELVEVLHARTAGNPFFIRQLLHDLVRDGALQGVRAAGGECWHLDVQRARSLAVADNVLAMLGARIGSLSVPLRGALEHAACIGQNFDHATLTSVLPADLAADWPRLLAELTNRGLLQAAGAATDSQFIHERIRDAALGHLANAERARIHLAIGQLWRDQSERSVFDVVGQLNRGSALMQGDTQRHDLALLNAQAARSARTQAAYAASLEHAGHALRLLPAASVRKHPSVNSDLHALLADAQASAGQLDAAVSTFEQALALAQSDDDKARTLERMCEALQSSGQPAQALLQVQRALDILGQRLDLPGVDDGGAQTTLQAEQQRLLAVLGSDDALQSLGRLGVADETAARIGRLYDKAIISAYFSRPDMLGFVTARSVEYVLKSGLTPEAALALGWWSMILCMHDKHALATQYARFVRVIHERFGNDYYGGGGRMVAAAMTLSWTRPYAESFAEAGHSARLLESSGNMQFASYGLITQHIIAVAEGAHCQAMLSTCDVWADFCARYVPLELGQARIRRYCIQRLMGLDPEPLDCEAIVQVYSEQDNATDVCESLTEMARFAMLTDDFAAALDLCERAHPYFCAGAAGNLLLNYTHLVMLAIASARMVRHASGEQRERLLAQFDECAARVTHLSALQTQNFSAYDDLVRAEGGRMRGDHGAALGAYFASIRHAREHGYALLQAQATQYLAELSQEEGHVFASSLQRGAEQLYRQAGCLIKVAGHRRDTSVSSASDGIDSSRSRRSSDVSRGVDMLSLTKANEAITSEMDYDRLLVRLLEITVESTGAQRGVLVLREDDDYFVVAESGEGRLHEPLESNARCPVQMVYYVARSGQVAVLENGQRRGDFREDPYFAAHPVRSVIAAPVVRQGMVRGVIYLENNAVDGAFGDDCLEVVGLLLGAAAIALENASLYSAQKQYADQLEARVKDRTIELENANAALARLAEIDGLTQLANRRSFDRCCADYAREFAAVTLLICDVDDFKVYNDQYGHLAGDEALRKVAAAMMQVEMPGSGVLARYGGEEFAVVLRGASPSAVERFATDLWRAVGALKIPHSRARAARHLTLSVGVARIPRLSSMSIASLIGAADKALYVAKQNGRNQVRLHTDFFASDTSSHAPGVEPGRP